MISEQLLNKIENLSVTHVPINLVSVKDDEIRVGNTVSPLDVKGRNVIERYIGFSTKFKKSVDTDLKDQVINKVFAARNTQVSIVHNGNSIVNIISGEKELVPLEKVFGVVDAVVPDGEVSLFKTDGFYTEFAVTSAAVSGSPTKNKADVTQGGVYLKAESLHSPRLTVIPILHRLVCANQMSREQKDSALKVKGNSYDEILPGLTERIEGYMNKTIPSQLNSWLGLTEFYPASPNKFALSLMSRAKLGKKQQEKVLTQLEFSFGKQSAYDVINAITALQHGVTQAQRDNLWRLGAYSLTLDEKALLSCNTCHSSL